MNAIRDKLKSCGKNVIIRPYILLIEPENIEIGNNCRIDDFIKIIGGKGVKIGDHVHISSYTSIIGGGSLSIGSFSTCAVGCRFITGNDDYFGNCMTNPTIPQKYREYCYRSHIEVKKHVILGTDTIVHPGVTIGEGAATGSGTIVTKNLDAWKIYIGTPARFYKNRRKDIILEMEEKLLKEESKEE